MSVPDYRVLCYGGSFRHIGCLRKEVYQRLAIGVGEGLAYDVSTCDIGRGGSITVLRPDCGALNSISPELSRGRNP